VTARRGDPANTVRIRCRVGTTTRHEWSFLARAGDPLASGWSREYDGTPEQLESQVAAFRPNTPTGESWLVVTRRVLTEPWA